MQVFGANVGYKLIFYQDFRCILVKFQMYNAPSMKLKHDVKSTEYIGKMSVDRQVLMSSETRFDIVFRIARARYSDTLGGHRDRKED